MRGARSSTAGAVHPRLNMAMRSRSSSVNLSAGGAAARVVDDVNGKLLEVGEVNIVEDVVVDAGREDEDEEADD